MNYKDLGVDLLQIESKGLRIRMVETGNREKSREKQCRECSKER